MALPEKHLSKLSFELAANGKDLLACYTSFPTNKTVNHRDLHELIEQAGYGNFRISESALKQLAQALRFGNDQGEMVVAEKLDGEFRITLSADAMQAFLCVYPAYGGNPVTEDEVLAAISAKNIRYGLDIEIVAQAVVEQASEPVEIASGKPVEDGKNSQFTQLLPQETSATNGVSHHFMEVHSGQVIMRRSPSSKGKNGIDILGREVMATPGINISFAPNLHGVGHDDTDPDILIAQIDGQAIVVERGMVVEPVLTLLNVDAATGDVEHEGTVRILGDVADATIKASADIFVCGGVEQAQLHAGRNIIVGKGVFGLLENHRGSSTTKIAGLLEAGQSISAKFIENTTVKAGYNLIVQNHIAHCEIETLNNILVGDISGNKGHIIGGQLNAAIELQASIIGSRAGIKTKIKVGGGPELSERNAHLRSCITAKEKERAKLYQLRDQLNRTATADNDDTLNRLNNTLVKLQADLVDLINEQEEITSKLRHIMASRVVVRQQIFEGAEICIGDQCYRVSDQETGGIFTLIGSRIRFRPL